MSANEIVWFRHIFEQYSQLKRFICAVDSKLSLCGSLSLGGTGFCLVLGGEVRAHVVYFAQKRQLAHIHIHTHAKKRTDCLWCPVWKGDCIWATKRCYSVLRAVIQSQARTPSTFLRIKAFPFFRQARTMRRILHLPKWKERGQCAQIMVLRHAHVSKKCVRYM